MKKPSKDSLTESISSTASEPIGKEQTAERSDPRANEDFAPGSMFQATAPVTKESRLVTFAGFVNGEPGVIERDVNDGNRVIAESVPKRTSWKADFREYLAGWTSRNRMR